MEKPKLVYILLICAVLFMLTFIGYSLLYQAASAQKEFKTVTEHGLLELKDYSIAYLVIHNREGRDANYTLSVFLDGSEFATYPLFITNGREIIYQHYLYPKKAEKKELSMFLYKENQTQPMESITLHVEGK